MNPTPLMMIPAKLYLETGEVFEGFAPEGQITKQFGEVVFNTGMVGYTECMTDPSYCGQILTFTYPLIGNYGVFPQSSWESKKAWVSGIVVSELADFCARSQASESLLTWCQSQKVAILTGVDTRALTHCLREKGVVAGAIVIGDSIPRAFTDINEQHLVAKVSIPAPLMFNPNQKTQNQKTKKLIAIDCGMKENIWRYLCHYDWLIQRVPYDYDFTSEPYDAVFISNGPGDPVLCKETIEILKKVLEGNKPVFGICLGSQLMGLAIGAKTYKLRFGHRSQNQPCLQEGTERVYLTSQNHGYAIDETTLPEDWRVTYRNLNDNSVQGIAHRSKPHFSVQFHPEAAPGPVDTGFLFGEFYQAVIRS